MTPYNIQFFQMGDETDFSDELVTDVILIGHSMGGIVELAAETLKSHLPNSVLTFICLNAPLRLVKCIV